MGTKMTFRPVSEKAAEILFNRFLLQAFPLGSLELFAPSSAEEFRTRSILRDAQIDGQQFLDAL